MKGIIIENEYEVDDSILAFLKDNPTLFAEVQEELYCLHRGEKELIPYIIENDAIIVASTWMYKDQLETFLDGFLLKEFPIKKIFVHDIVRVLNDWLYSSYSSERTLVEKVINLINKGFEIFTFRSDYDSEEIFDDLNWFRKERNRFPYTYKKIKYSKEYNFFYEEGTKEYIENLKTIFLK